MANVIVQHSAGGIVYRGHGKTIEVVMIKDSYGKWTFPKGHVEAGETLEETAKREISEEIGIDEHSLRTRAHLGDVDYWFALKAPGDFAHVHKLDNATAEEQYGREPQPDNKKDGPEVIHKFVTYYLFEVPFDTELSPQPGEVQAAEWIPYTEMKVYSQYADNQSIITKATTFFQNH